MKKIVLSASILVLAVSASFAQEVKPKKGDIVFGTALQSPFASGSPFSLVNGGLNVRYFAAEGLALRTNLNFTRNANRTNGRDSVFLMSGGKELVEGFSKKTNSMFDLRLGAEKHFSGTEKLDPYAGADLILGFGSNREKEENFDGSTVMKDYSKKSKQPVLAFGLGLVVGADYYVLPKLYLGTEFGWSFVYNRVGQKTTTTTSKNGNSTTTTETITAGSSNSKAGAGMTTGAFRIGFRF